MIYHHDLFIQIWFCNKSYAKLFHIKVTSTIAASMDGLSENRLKHMFDIPYHLWSTLYYGIETYLVKKEAKLE